MSSLAPIPPNLLALSQGYGLRAGLLRILHKLNVVQRRLVVALGCPRYGDNHAEVPVGDELSESAADDLAYVYDPAGLRTAVHGSFARTGLPAATTSNAAYDLANRLTSWNGQAVTSDNNGNLTA